MSNSDAPNCKRLALFKSVGEKGDYTVAWPERMTNKSGTIEGYVRVSEYVTVTFPERSESPIPEEIAQLDAMLNDVKVDFKRKVDALETAKANLLAITDQRAVA